MDFAGTRVFNYFKENTLPHGHLKKFAHLAAILRAVTKAPVRFFFLFSLE